MKDFFPPLLLTENNGTAFLRNKKTLWSRSHWSIPDFPAENWLTKLPMSRVFLFQNQVCTEF